MKNNPYISIIIIAYNRKEFLLDAFNSALNQTLDRSKYEIIVTKNFRDNKIDSYIKKNGGKLVFFDKPGIGPRIADALKYANGEVICFLEDDDLFTNEKLELVYRLFKDNKALAYYRHNYCAIDENGKILKGFKYGISNKKLYFNQKDRSEVYRFILGNLYFNTSTTCIKKAIILKQKNNLNKLFYNPDDFWAYSSLSSGFHLLCDVRVLSKYRIHNNNISFTIDQHNEYNTHSKKILKNLFKKAKAHKLLNAVLEAKSIRFELDHKILNNEKITFRQTINYLHLYSIPYFLYFHKIDFFAFLVLLSLFDGKLARDILRRRITNTRRIN